ncbi:AMP-binding protein [Microlunatus soli]|uniref:Acyl-CoA synthetase (AMP-forming)/AMP-acid ligase II n=1 Tax=Microlunatus soli TaxID=630515 RepID=A0A1H1TFL4_9ACTN|nr:AMP-binding protein [Microlunatus soli]SDS58958.1 Acyl-CoA synthetase (AMP-forming)/AMP-acid ligase II [Microlunatus soli]
MDLGAAVYGVLRYGATPAAVGFLAGRRSAPVLFDDDGAVSGADLWAAVQATAADWARRSPGRHRIGVLCDQDRNFVIALLAGSALGWDVVGLGPRNDDARLASMIDRHRLTAIAGTDRSRLASVAGDHPVLPISTGTETAGRRAPKPRRRGQVILLSSGTTGAPTASGRRRYGPGLARPVIGLWRLLQPAGGPMLIMAPLWHGYGLGMLMLALAGGVPVLLTRRRSAVDLATIADQRHVRTIVVLPVQLAALIERWPSRPASLHRVITGSAPLSPDLSRRALDVVGPRLINLYGSTEAGWATWATPADLARAPGTVGRPAPGVRVTIIDGQVHIDSPLGTDPRRPTPTGDRGHFGDHGGLMIDGRLDDIVIINGNNVSLSAVQRALDDHPQLDWARVRAEADPIRGHRLIADVRTTSGADLAVIVRQLARVLDWYAVPRLRSVSGSTPDDGSSGEGLPESA